MSEQGYTHITIILDRSGSMESIRDDIIGGFNAFVREQKAQPGEATLTLVQFDSQDPYEVLEDFRRVADVAELSAAEYVPRASTPLLDALGRGISDLTAKIATLPEDRRPENVVFVILTDGRENASAEYNKAQIVEMIQRCREDGWRFLFLSADLDAIRDAIAYGIDPADTVSFAKTDVGTLSAYAETNRLVGGLRSASTLRELLRDGTIAMVFQPIVMLPQESVVGYEALGRGRHPALPRSPMELFELAGALGPDAQAELSRLFRRKAVELFRDRPNPPLVFLNTHPAELEQSEPLLESLQDLRQQSPSVQLVLEVPESVLANPEFIAWLHGRLAELRIGLAYDEFGAGQARLLAMAKAPPDYLKFDRLLVTGIDRAAASRRRLTESLCAAARELMVKTVAQNVETAEEAETCRRLGFSHAQGFFFGKPKPIDELY